MTQKKKNKGVSHPLTVNNVKLHAIKSRALDVDCYRGFARLSDLAKISKPDEYDEVKHPEGIQRELKPKHAREAYDYAANPIPGKKRIWPEVILSLRDKKGVFIKEHSKWKGAGDYFPVTLTIDMTRIQLDKVNPTFSRVDGNHRLHFAEGIDKKRPALDGVISPFCIMQNLIRDQEVLIFKTINEKQVKLRTDHLLRIEGQITSKIDLMEKHPVLWLTEKLRDDQTSPFYNLVHIAGTKAKDADHIIRQKSLYDGINLLYKELEISYKEGDNLRTLPKIIIRYLNAVKKRWTNEWNNPKKYLLMSNTGMQAMGLVGARMIDRQIKAERVEEEDFLRELKASQFSWEKVQGGDKLPTGRAGGEIIAHDILSSIYGGAVDLSKLIR